MDLHLNASDIQTEEEIYKAIMNPQTILEQANTHGNEENSEAPPSSKEIEKALNVLRRVVQKRTIEKGFNSFIRMKIWS